MKPTDASPSEASRLLIVDDDPDLRAYLSEMLGGAGFHVESAASSNAALELLEKSRFDLLLVDVQLPGESGLEMLRRLPEHAVGTSVIIMTAYPTVPAAVQALRLSVADFLSKPLGEELIDRVERGVELTRERRAREQREAELGRWSSELRRLLDAMDRHGTGETPDVGIPTSGRGISAEALGDLSGREREVVAALLEGLGTDAIASKLFISPKTVRNHLHTVMRKLNVSSRVELVARLRSPAS